MKIIQLRLGRFGNISYLIGDETNGQAFVIDPSAEVDAILDAARESGLSIRYVLNTHGHSDHTAGNAELRARTGAKVLIHQADADRVPDADRFLNEEKVLRVGGIPLDILHTPGHTPGSICLYSPGNLFTGDTLFVGDSGRTDLPGGDRPVLGASLRKLMTLPDDTVVWPGHDYGPTPSSTIGWEKRNNVNAREYGFDVKR